MQSTVWLIIALVEHKIVQWKPICWWKIRRSDDEITKKQALNTIIIICTWCCINLLCVRKKQRHTQRRFEQCYALGYNFKPAESVKHKRKVKLQHAVQAVAMLASSYNLTNQFTHFLHYYYCCCWCWCVCSSCTL